MVSSVEFIVTTEKSKCKLLDSVVVCTYRDYNDLANQLIVIRDRIDWNQYHRKCRPVFWKLKNADRFL